MNSAATACPSLTTELINAHDIFGTFAYYETCTPIHSQLLLLTISVFVYEYLVNVYEVQQLCCVIRNIIFGKSP